MPIGGVGSISVPYSDCMEDTVRVYSLYSYVDPVVVVYIILWVFGFRPRYNDSHLWQVLLAVCAVSNVYHHGGIYRDGYIP